MLLLSKDLPDKAGLALGGIGIGIGVKTNRFTIRFSDDSSKPIELYADDAQTKSEWLQGKPPDTQHYFIRYRYFVKKTITTHHCFLIDTVRIMDALIVTIPVPLCTCRACVF